MALDPELTKDWLDFDQFKEMYMNVPVEEYPNNVLEAIPEPVLSVHIITYQHVNYIRDAIEGVLIQKTDFPLEIIIGDDESTDGTREICIEYAKKYPNKIRLFMHKRENNISILGNPSHIFQYAFNSYNLRGKYVAVCSGDDYWIDPLKLQKQVDFLNNNNEYSITGHDAKIVDANKNLINESRLPDRFKKDASKDELKKGYFILALSMCFRNIFYKIPKEFFNIINEDKFIISLLGAHGKYKYLSEIRRSIYTKHDNSIWSSHINAYKNYVHSVTYCYLSKFYKKNDKNTHLYFKEEKNKLLFLSLKDTSVFNKCFSLRVYLNIIFDLSNIAKPKKIYNLHKKIFIEKLWKKFKI